MLLSRHFDLATLIHSDTALERGIDNTPSPDIIENLRSLAQGLDQVQDLLGAPLEISSGYRCPTLNKAVGGTERSQHCEGLAADFTCDGFGTPFEVAKAIRDSAIEFDQCIMEFGRWVHLSFSHTPRRRMLSIYDGKEGYLDGLVERQVV